jgi:hypothetical protein
MPTVCSVNGADTSTTNGYTAADVLAAMTDRLHNDIDTERKVVRNEGGTTTAQAWAWPTPPRSSLQERLEVAELADSRVTRHQLPAAR